MCPAREVHYRVGEAVRAVFAYEHRYRVVEQFHVKQSRAGDWLLVGRDPDKNEWRSFRLDRAGVVRLVPNQR